MPNCTVRYESAPFSTIYPFVFQTPLIIRKKVDRQLTHLTHNIRHPALNAKKMSGEDDIWEARIDIHYRLTFRIEGDTIVLRKVGTHEIYRHP